MPNDLAGGYSTSFPADLRSGAGYRVEKKGLSAQIVADFRGVPLLTVAPAAGHVLVQRPEDGSFDRLDLSSLPTTVPQDGSVTPQKFAASPPLTLFGNPTGATAQPQFLGPSDAKAALTLDQVNNTSDAAKPVSIAQGMAIAARLASASNLSDLTSAPAARGNLGLDTAATISDTVRAAVGNPVGNAIGDRTRIGLCISPWDKGANGQGAADDTAALQACVNQVQALQNSGFIGHAVIDLRGGTFAISAPITMSGSPYDITFQNGSLRPFGSYSGILIDLNGATATTRLRFLNIAFNGYEQCSKLLRMSKRTQGVWVAFCTFIGFTQCGFEDQTAAPATEIMLICNEFQGGASANVGTAIILSGNDGYVCDNNIRNVSIGIKNTQGGNAILRNHIYSISPTLPIPAVLSETGDQMQINDNYIDCAYLDIKMPSNCQIHNNKFFMTGTGVSGFAAIVLRPTANGQTLQCISALGNNFCSLFQVYNPVRVDTSAGTIGACYQTIMDRNTFFGFNKMATEPKAIGTASAVTFVAYNFFSVLPWGSLKRIMRGSVITASSYVTTHTLSGSVGFLSFGNASGMTGASTTGEWTMQGSVNDDFI